VAFPVFPTEGGGSKFHAGVEDDGVGGLQAVAIRSRRSEIVNGERIGAMGTYPESGALENGAMTTTGTSAIALSATSIPCQGLVVKADKNNLDTVYVGKSDVTANATNTTGGYPLEPGESVGVPCRNVNEVYIRRPGSNNVAVAWIASAD